MILKNFQVGEIVELFDSSLPMGIGGNGEFFRIISITEGPQREPNLVVISHILEPLLEIKITDCKYIRKISSRRLCIVKALYKISEDD